MHKQSFLENMSPEQRGALIGGLVGAGGLGLTAAAMSGKNKMRNAILAALAGGLGGAGLGYLHGGGSLFSNKPAPDKPSNDRVAIDPKTGKPPEYEGGFQFFKQLPGLGKPKAPQFNDQPTSTSGVASALGQIGNIPGLGLGAQALAGTIGAAGAAGGYLNHMAGVKKPKVVQPNPLEDFADQEAPELPAAGGPGSSFKQPKA